MRRRAVLHALAVLGLGVAGSACRSSEAASPHVPSTIGGVGALPGEVSELVPAASSAPSAPLPAPTRPPESNAPAPPPATTSPVLVNDGTTTVGRLVDGNRVLAIGDSIMASVSSRYGDQLCGQLVPRGWEVAVDAEVGRFVEFGREVLETRRIDDWDAAIVMLGNNYDGNPDTFTRELDALLDALEPLPVVLLNVTRFEPEQDEVNWILAVAAERRDDVVLLDWAARTADDAPRADDLLAGDGLHLSTAGQEALAQMIGRVMGRAPSGSRGECLPARTDDDRERAARDRRTDDDRVEDREGDRGGTPDDPFPPPSVPDETAPGVEHDDGDNGASSSSLPPAVPAGPMGGRR